MRASSVAVILSTCNGAQYLQEQLDSIFLQAGVAVHLIVRDDGSTDHTLQILKENSRKHTMTVHTGKNLGPARSYFSLTGLVPDHYSYIALADQDDVWFPEKLFSAVQMLSEYDPEDRVLYCGSAYLCDAAGQSLNRKIPTARKPPGLNNAIVQNVSPGCTMVLTRGLKKNLLNFGLPLHPYMHDWWIYLCASAFGKVLFDHTPRMNYRLHGSNVLGYAPRKLVFFRPDEEWIIKIIDQLRDFHFMCLHTGQQRLAVKVTPFAYPPQKTLRRLAIAFAAWRGRQVYRQHFLGDVRFWMNWICFGGRAHG